MVAGQAERAAERRTKALELRKGGASYREIAAGLGVSVRQAFMDVRRELAVIVAKNTHSAEELKALTLARLDRLLFYLDAGIRAGDAAAIREARHIEAQRASLCGYAAPQKVAFTDPTGEHAAPTAAGAMAAVDELLQIAIERRQQRLLQAGTDAALPVIDVPPQEQQA